MSTTVKLGAVKLIGHSLSFCIRDVIMGKVAEESIAFIVAGTKMRTDEDIEHTMSSYRKGYWHSDPDRAEALARKLLTEGRIIQPRLEDENHPMLQYRNTWEEAV